MRSHIDRDAHTRLASDGPMYDPERYWDGKADQAAGDPLAAVCTGDALRDACIDRVQRSLLRWAFTQLASPPVHGCRVLDFGCGTGRFYPIFTAQGAEYSGVDLSQRMIEMARSQFPHGMWQKLDGPQLPFDDDHFDLVTSMAVLHHNAYPIQGRLLGELVRTLKPGGNLILFEGIGLNRSAEGGPFFYRPVSDWLAATEALGLERIGQRCVRYGILEGLWHSLWQRCAPVSWRTQRRTICHRFWLGMDVVLDPYLLATQPWAIHDRWCGVFRKRA